MIARAREEKRLADEAKKATEQQNELSTKAITDEIPALESVDLAKERKNETKSFKELMKEAKQKKEAATIAQSSESVIAPRNDTSPVVEEPTTESK